MYYFIVNPASRSGKGLRVWDQIEPILQGKNIEYEALMLDGPEDAARAAGHICAHTPCTAVVLGGDGTVNEFINGLTDFSGITFGYIPTGSGNDFGRGMHLPVRPMDALEIILSPSRTREVNIGCASSGEKKQYFAVSAGFGYDAAVCYAVENAPGKSFMNAIHAGKFVYLFHALRMLFTIPRFDARLVTDEGELVTYHNVYFAAAMNTKYEGGGFMFCPKASPVDNCLDIILAEGISRLRVLTLLPLAFFGKHVGKQGIHIMRCRRVVLHADSEECVHTDGEHFGFTKKITFEVLPQKLNMIVD